MLKYLIWRIRYFMLGHLKSKIRIIYLLSLMSLSSYALVDETPTCVTHPPSGCIHSEDKVCGNNSLVQGRCYKCKPGSNLSSPSSLIVWPTLIITNHPPYCGYVCENSQNHWTTSLANKNADCL